MDRKLIDTPEIFAIVAETYGGPPALKVGINRSDTGFEQSRKYDIHQDDPGSPLESVRTDFGEDVAWRIGRAALLACITHPDDDKPAGN